MPDSLPNAFGTASVSLGGPQQHSLEVRLVAAAKAGFTQIDLFDECWAEYLKANGQDPEKLWDATPENLRIARQLGDLVKSHHMRIACTQPLRSIEGRRDPAARAEALKLVSQRFPFMRAFDTDLVFMCSNLNKEPQVTTDLKTVAADLRECGIMAEDFALRDGGAMLKVGYEALGWGQRNTWLQSWEVVRAANRHNVGLILDSFNLLAAEWADPYASAGHGRVYPSAAESTDVLRLSLASLVATVPGDRIFLYQVADAELMDPKVFKVPKEDDTPALMPWSRRHRLYPLEKEQGAYLPVDIVTAAVLATGYQGPLSLEVFNGSMYEEDAEVPEQHAKRGAEGLRKLVEATSKVEKFWDKPAQDTVVHQQWKTGQTAKSKEGISAHS